MKISSKDIYSISNKGVEVIIEDLKNHPICPHGPTLLFSRRVGKKNRKFFACSACRDRKLCNFFLWADERDNISKTKLDAWNSECIRFLKGINHRKKFLILNKVKALESTKRVFCNSCSIFITEQKNEHKGHRVVTSITDYQLEHPTEVLIPLDNSKKEAQYLFSKESVEFLVNSFLALRYRHVICIGTPRIHEFIRSNVPNLTSILLDIDDRFHNFFGPLEFCWYNSFNNHFFFKEAQEVFNDYVKFTGGNDTVLITDPPFGGRTEPLVHSLTNINEQYKALNKKDLDIFWIFPYFMEPQIVNLLPKFHMLDYKVEYDNHPLFQTGSRGRKQGSPVRIFTNVSPSLIKLPAMDYKYCKKCVRWISKENRHCNSCGQCTSKNGQTYKHCTICDRCVKPNWQHCSECQRCAQVNHKCGEFIKYTGICLHCKVSGHKRVDCPQLKNQSQKRKKGSRYTHNKKVKH